MDAKACRKQGKTYFPKDKKCLDLTFKVRDPQATRKNHITRIGKLKEKGIKFDDILPKQPKGPDYSGERAIWERLQYDKYYLHKVYNSEDWKKCNQQTAKEMKPRINDATREEIKFQLRQEGISEAFDTAFYMMHYNRVNNLMKKVLKDAMWCK